MRACDGLKAEVLVVDNQSQDGSADMVATKFPGVKLIASKENLGFAKANNLAVKQATGAYILYLNPDTLVPEDCFRLCLAYMEQHPRAGALGCRLVDGKGQFLPESKRGFPSAQVAFFKICGLSALFKRSAFFNQYHLGHLPEMETHSIDVLVGCFMFCRKSVIDQVGSFDPEYFMYGEDIDLSYRIRQAGFENVYFPGTTVIHFKGESTKKGSMNYVRMFYQAMIIFARKHFSRSQKGLFVPLIQLAIYLRAILAFVGRIFSVIRLPLIDAGIMLASLVGMKNLWLAQVKTGTQYSSNLLSAFFLAYILIWTTSLYLNGAYDRPYKPGRVMRGMLVGALLSLALYGLLPEALRFSRGITVLGALLAALLILSVRKLLQWLGVKSVEGDEKDKPVIIVGTMDEEQEVRYLLQKAFVQKEIVGSVSPFDGKEMQQLGIFAQLEPLRCLYRVREIIFTQHHLSFKQIIDYMSAGPHDVEYKIHSMGTDSIIGSNSKDTAGDLYTTELTYAITTPSARRNKRVIDVVVSLGFILFSPFLVWFVKNKNSYFLNMFLVLEGDKTLVGYTDPQFPALKPHVLDVYPVVKDFEIPADNREHLDWLYAKNYTPADDLRILWKKWRDM